jgi:hypothetical protein
MVKNAETPIKNNSISLDILTDSPDLCNLYLYSVGAVPNRITAIGLIVNINPAKVGLLDKRMCANANRTINQLAITMPDLENNLIIMLPLSFLDDRMIRICPASELEVVESKAWAVSASDLSKILFAVRCIPQ